MNSREINCTLESERRVRLGRLAVTRSGDKGNHANLGVVAADADVFDHLVEHLTVEVVESFFRPWGTTRVERFLLPNVWALNFVLYNVLAGGASRSLRTDTQGKLIGTAAAELLLPAFVATRGPDVRPEQAP